MQIRKLTGVDQAAARALGEEAFGSHGDAPIPTEVPPGRHPWGAFDGDRLVAKVVAHEYISWWHGQRLPTCGIAGVAVAAEHRGGGLLRDLFAHALAEAVERGEVVSILYPTANGIYRSLGYELIGSFDTVEVPTAELGRIAAPAGTVTTRRATAADAGAIRATYDAWARKQNGPLTRTGPLFDHTDAQLATEPDHTLALDAAGEVVGVLAWSRDRGYGAQGRLVVRDLFGLTADAYRALWRIAGSFASVTGVVRLTTSGADPARHLLPSMTWDVVDRHPVMLRVLAPAPALAHLTGAGPRADDADLTIAVRGDRLGVLDGSYTVSGGTVRESSHTEDTGDEVATYTPQGLALAFAGVQNSGNLRMLDHLTGPRDHDRALDALGTGRPVHLRDYF